MRFIVQILSILAVLIYSQSYIFVGLQYKELFFDGAVMIVYFAIVVLSNNRIWKLINLIIMNLLMWNFVCNTASLNDWVVYSKGIISGMSFIFTFVTILKIIKR